MSAASNAGAASSAGAKRAFPGAAADANAERRVQPRHFHDGPNPIGTAVAAAASTNEVAEAEGPPPATRLYRHALESIFAFLGRKELAMALRVSRDWLAAVKSMASLDLAVEKPSAALFVVAGSLMSRHVACLGSVVKRLAVTADSLFILARFMPQLRELRCEMPLVLMAPMQGQLTFPGALRSLTLRLLSGPGAAADVNAVLRAVSRLPLLESLDMRLSTFNDEVSFAPLAAMRLLRDLHIIMPHGGPQLNDAQVADMRAMPHLRQLQVEPTSIALLRRLLAQPHSLQWQTLNPPIPVNDEAAALLPQLPSLTSLHAWTQCVHFDWLRGMPDLLDVNLLEYSGFAGRATSLVNGLRQCKRVERLSLEYFTDLNAAHLTELLPQLPQLRDLTLSGLGITSLSFLAQGAVTSSLRSLKLSCCKRLPLTELQHAHSLRDLKTLRLHGCFTTPMDAHCQSLYMPPSLLLPQLEEFDYSGEEEYDEEIDEDGAGGQ